MRQPGEPGGAWCAAITWRAAATGSTRPQPGLPATGSESNDLLAAAVLLLASGGVLMLATRRRK